METRSNRQTITSLAVVVAVLLAAVVGLMAYMAGRRNNPTPSSVVVQQSAETPAKAGSEGANGEASPSRQSPTATTSGSPDINVTVQTPAPAKSSPSTGAQPQSAPKTQPQKQPAQPATTLESFPQTLAALRANSRALAAAKAVVQGSRDNAALDSYGAHSSAGWVAKLDGESGPFVELGVSEGWGNGSYGSGYYVVLRKTDSGYRYQFSGQDTPSLDDVKRAGITPEEYQKHLLAYIGQWPAGTSGEAKSW